MDIETRNQLRKAKIRRLKNVTVQEVSLVDVPAVRKFLLYKRQGGNVDIVNTLDEEEVNRSFAALPFKEQERFLLEVKKLLAKVAALPGSEDDFLEDPTGELACEINYEFGALNKADKEQVLKRLTKIAKEVAEIEKAAMPESAKDALVSIYKTELGMIRLFLRSPETFDELNKALETRDRATLESFAWTPDENGVPIITKRLRRVFAETKTHEQVEDDSGRIVWKPKQKRTPDGRFA